MQGVGRHGRKTTLYDILYPYCLALAMPLQWTDGWQHQSYQPLFCPLSSTPKGANPTPSEYLHHGFVLHYRGGPHIVCRPGMSPTRPLWGSVSISRTPAGVNRKCRPFPTTRLVMGFPSMLHSYSSYKYVGKFLPPPVSGQHIGKACPRPLSITGGGHSYQDQSR